VFEELWRNVVGAPNSEATASIVAAFGSISDPSVETFLIEMLTKEFGSLQAIRALSRKRGPSITAALFKHFLDDQPLIRSEAVAAIAQTLPRTQACLLSRDLDAAAPWIDPKLPIGNQDVATAARQLRLTVDQTKKEYEALKEALGGRLVLAWQNS
jgi:hypothetical protein